MSSALFECVNAGGQFVVSEDSIRQRTAHKNEPSLGLLSYSPLVLVQRHPCRHLVDAALHVFEQGGVLFKLGGLLWGGSFAFL